MNSEKVKHNKHQPNGYIIKTQKFLVSDLSMSKTKPGEPPSYGNSIFLTKRFGIHSYKLNLQANLSQVILKISPPLEMPDSEQTWYRLHLIELTYFCVFAFLIHKNSHSSWFVLIDSFRHQKNRSMSESAFIHLLPLRNLIILIP